MMITEDSIDTAVAISKALGILSDRSIAMTGLELNALSDEEFETMLRSFSVYARVQPEYKTRIVNARHKFGCVPR